MSGSSDVFADTDLLEEILVRVPHEFIFNCILVSKRWFGLISGSSFLEHYVKIWSDQINLMHYRQHDPKPSAEANELQRGLQSPRLAALNELQYRLQSQQCAALDQLKHLVDLNQPRHRPFNPSEELAELIEMNFYFLNGFIRTLHSDRVDALNELYNKLKLAAENQSELLIHDIIFDAQEHLADFITAHKSQQERQSTVLVAVNRLLKYCIPSQRWAIVNEVQHQIVCELLVVVNEAQRKQYYDLIHKPLERCLSYKSQQ